MILIIIRNCLLEYFSVRGRGYGEILNDQYCWFLFFVLKKLTKSFV